jgi:hypothetical protein
MSSKKKTTGNPNMQTLRIGSRVRCTDDGVEGRISWANAVSVKIKWDDGEQVTWKRDSLAGRPIQILDAEAAGGETEASPIAVEQTATEAPIAEPALVPEAETAATTEVPAAEAPAQEPPRAAPADSSTEPTPAPAKPKRQPKAPAQPKEKKVSALDAAAQVLAEENHPMTCKEMIDAMAAKGYWASPGGKTPEATLYSAILREMSTKGANARFAKTERGKFARKANG